MRRLLAFILTATAALALAGCRADAGKVDSGVSSLTSPEPHEPTRAAPVADTRPALICFGDSITAGYGVEPGQAYPDDLQKLLDQDGYPYYVRNEGISGNTTKDGLDRLPRVLAHHPAVVVLEFGGNDGLRGLPLEQTESNLATMIERMQATGIKVALAGITLPPDYGQAYIRQFNAVYPALARRYRIPYEAFLLQGVYGVPGSMQADGIHPTAQGAVQVAANIENLIAPLLHH
jgi:acyl-CoA thioesterase-1